MGVHELAVVFDSAAAVASVVIPSKLVHESLLSSAKPHRVYNSRDRVGAQRSPEQQDVRLRPKKRMRICIYEV